MRCSVLEWSFERAVAIVKKSFFTAWRVYTGLTGFGDDYKCISGDYYIRKPVVYERSNPRTGRVHYFELVAELPQAKPKTPPEYIVVAAYRTMKKRVVPRDYSRVAGYINSRLEELQQRLPGDRHFFIYIVCSRYTRGVRKLYAQTVDRLAGKNALFKITGDPKTVVVDLANYVHKRLEKLLSSVLEKSGEDQASGLLFGRPKHLAAYLLLLEALLSNREDVAELVPAGPRPGPVPARELAKLQALIYTVEEEEWRIRSWNKNF